MYHPTNPTSLRSICLQWINQTTATLGLKSRTQELVLILVDSVLDTTAVADKDLEAFCASCIIFIVKLETDFNQNFPQFIDYITNSMLVSPSDLTKMEALLLKIIPSDFIRIIPMSEIALLINRHLGPSSYSSQQAAETDYYNYIAILINQKPSNQEFDAIINRLVSFVNHASQPNDQRVRFESQLRRHDNCPHGSICALQPSFSFPMGLKHVTDKDK
jgi:hypothetical protein